MLVAEKNLGWGRWCFAGVFAKSGVQNVVFLWWKRGGSVVKRGEKMSRFAVARVGQVFRISFFDVLR
jgi:hypothetical protein